MLRCLLCELVMEPIGIPPACPNCGAKVLPCDPVDELRTVQDRMDWLRQQVTRRTGNGDAGSGRERQGLVRA